jgi:protoporphyrinogen/coproporphyrinogen III oxidase
MDKLNGTADAPVVVVGGGIAGLTAAYTLQQRGIPVRVFEGAPRPGGRIHSVSDRGTLETGMQFYYSSYRDTFDLLRTFGLTDSLVPIHVRGLMCHEGDIRPFDKAKPWLGLLSTADNLRLQGAVARQLMPLLRMSPFDFRADDPLDRIDSAAYFMELGGDAVVELAVRPMVTSYAFTEPEGHSLAMLLRIMRLGAFSKMYGLLGGNDGLPAAMAKQLDVVHRPVREIVVEQGRTKGVLVETDHGTEFVAARAVICAVRGSQAGALLPGAPWLSAAFDQLSYSNIVLANLHLDRPLTGADWTYVLSRRAGHRAAFAVDLTRRSPGMFPDDRSVIQVDFADPEAGRLLGASNEEITAAAAADMEAFLPGIGGWVTHTSVVRRPAALPNFDVGMFGRVRAIEGMAGEIAGLHLAGDYLRAPLCEGAVRSGIQAAGQVATALTRPAQRPFEAASAPSRR